MSDMFQSFKMLCEEWLRRARLAEVRQILEVVTAELQRRGEPPPCQTLKE